MMQTLLKNLFNSINLLQISLSVIFTKIFQKPSVKGTSRYQKINFFTTSASIVILFTVAGCGYTFQGRETLPFNSVSLGKIENRTSEPKLEDKLKKALADELIKYGITVSKNSEHTINGVIETFELKPLSEKEGLAEEYEIIIKGKFFLISPDGKAKELRNSGAFIASFPSSGNIQQIMSSKEQAIEGALKGLSSEIRAGIVYQ